MATSRHPDLVLHVGMQQSGAAMVQRALGRLRPQLRRQGVAFVAQPAIGALPHAAGQLGAETPDPLAGEAFASELRQLVDDERRATSAVSRRPGPVLISSDVLLGAENLGLIDAEQFRPHAVRTVGQVIEALGARRVRVMLVIQRQDRLMEFGYLREVQAGRWGRLRDQFPHRFTPEFDYVELLQRLATVPNVTDVQVRPVELAGADPRRFVDDFLACVGLKGQLDLEALPTDLRLHRSYSKRGLRIALAMIPHLETTRDRERLRAFILENFPAETDHQSYVFRDEERRQVVAAHRAVNRALFANYLPDLPPDSYGTVEATGQLAEALPPVRPPLNVRTRRLARQGAEVARVQGRRGLTEITHRLGRNLEQQPEGR